MRTRTVNRLISVCILAIWSVCFLAVFGAVSHINEHGLKSIAERIWEGKQ